MGTSDSTGGTGETCVSVRTLKLDLDVWQEKLCNLTNENTKLQQELSEVYTIKSKFAQLLKLEVDKSAFLENELNFFQTQALTALSVRDTLLEEIKNFERKEEDAMHKITELQDRLVQVTSEYTEEKDLESFDQEVDLYKKVVERFWRVREQAIGAWESKHIQEKAIILLQDDEAIWSCSEMNKTLHDEAKQAIIQDGLQVCRASLVKFQAKIEKESSARKRAEDSLRDCRQQLPCLAELVSSELRQLSSAKVSLKEDIAVLFREEKNWILSLPEALRHRTMEGTGITDCGCSTNANKANGQQESRETVTINSCNTEEAEDCKTEEMVTRPVNLNDNRAVVADNCMLMVDDSKEALAQAVQEKVAALLLLSQQEERHILESNSAAVLESEIFCLKGQLLQVTSEKVDALVELARVHEELLKLQKKENSGLNGSAEGAKKGSVRKYLKNWWLKGPELGARLSHKLTLRVNKENDSIGIDRILCVENVTLRESLTSICHLCRSANRLRLTIARVAAESSEQTESTMQAAVDAVDGVISEALQLKVALHSSLPVDDLGWNSISSPLTQASEMSGEGLDNETTDDLDTVSFFGLEIVRLVLLAAQLQKRFLG